MSLAQLYERAGAVAAIAAALPDVEAELREMEEKRLAAAFAELRAGELKPEKAHSILMEIHSYRELARKLRRRTTEGGTA